MNVRNKINQLLIALGNEGFFYKIKTEMFFSEKYRKYFKKYYLYLKFEEKEHYWDGEEYKENIKVKYIQVKESFKLIDILLYLVDEYKDIQKEKEKGDTEWKNK